jgi:hypothetical protein
LITDHPEFQRSHLPKLESALEDIVSMQYVGYSAFFLQHVSKAHILPLTDVMFNKIGISI